MRLFLCLFATLAGGIWVLAWAGGTAPAYAADNPPASAPAAAYAVKVEVGKVEKGKRAVAKIHISPGAGYHMNKEYPTQVRLTEVPAGVTVDGVKVPAAALTEAACDFDVPFTANQVGKQVIGGEIRFAVCTASSCDPKKEKLALAFDVK
jgi:hypothetical protein